MTDKEKRYHREMLKNQIRVNYNHMKDTWNIELLEYLEGHCMGVISAFNSLGVITNKVRFKYQDFIVAVYENRKAVIK